MAGQPYAQEKWVIDLMKEYNELLPNKSTAELFRGNGGLQINEPGAVCRVVEMQASNYITDYDNRRINGLAGTNQNGNDGWAASAYGVFQDVRFDSKTYKLGRHRSLAYRLYEDENYTGPLGNYGTATQSDWETSGSNLVSIGEQMSALKARVDKDIIGPDVDKYNVFCACNGHMAGRVVALPGYMDEIFDGNCEHYTWVAQPGPFGDADMLPRFAPIQCIDFDMNNIMESLETIRLAWEAVNIDPDKCIICMDPRYALDLRKALWGNHEPWLESVKNEMVEGVKNGFKLDAFQICYDIKTSYFPKIYVDQNLNVVHSPDGKAAYDDYINSITPDESDPNPLRTKLIASHRMGVNNFIRTEWDDTQKKFVKKVWNYPLGETGAIDYFGERIEVEYKNWKTDAKYPNTEPGQGYGLPGRGKASKGYTEATGPVGEIKVVQVIGLAFYPEAIAQAQFHSDVVTDEGNTRGRFTEMCWDFKCDCWVLEKYAAGVIPIISVTEAANKQYGIVAKTDTTVLNSVEEPVNTKEVAATNKTKATK